MPAGARKKGSMSLMMYSAKQTKGIIHVLVNGDLALENGEMTGSFKGRFIPYEGGKRIKKGTL